MPDHSDFSYLSEMMRKHGVTCTPEEFHAAVNIAFHKYESEHYDEGHRDMWDSLPTQFSLLTGDCLRQIGLPARMNALDIGCGTGLASDCLLRTELGKRIASINLLDTSAAMLSR